GMDLTTMRSTDIEQLRGLAQSPAESVLSHNNNHRYVSRFNVANQASHLFAVGRCVPTADYLLVLVEVGIAFALDYLHAGLCLDFQTVVRLPRRVALPYIDSCRPLLHAPSIRLRIRLEMNSGRQDHHAQCPGRIDSGPGAHDLVRRGLRTQSAQPRLGSDAVPTALARRHR